MCCKGLLKRFLPFAAALVLGVFIAGLFGSFSTPRFGRWRGGHHMRDDQQIRAQLATALAENERLRAELELRNSEDNDFIRNAFDADVPMPPAPPMPPAAPQPPTR